MDLIIAAAATLRSTSFQSEKGGKADRRQQQTAKGRVSEHLRSKVSIDKPAKARVSLIATSRRDGEDGLRFPTDANPRQGDPGQTAHVPDVRTDVNAFRRWTPRRSLVL